MNRRHQESRNERLQRKKEEIALRLRDVCANFDSADLERLIERMAEIEIKYAMRVSNDWPREMRTRARAQESGG